MKFSALLALVAAANAEAVAKDSTITKVVKLLQNMMEKSVKEGDEERKIYAKFKCYCDQSKAEKDANIKELTDTIGILESKIAELQGSNGELSSEVADLKAGIAANVAAQDEATTIRNKENKAYKAEKADLEQAIEQMKQAIETLSAVGADQTKSTGADNKQFMAGKKAALVNVKAQVETALKAASSLLDKKQQSTATAFLQAPFTGTYTSQSAEVLGILKNMRDTFKANLADAITTEKNSVESYDKFMTVKKDAEKKMRASYNSKQKELGANDASLSAKKTQLSQAEKEKASDEEFLSKLLPMCADKAKGYANRKMLRANEEAAISEAISILNSDASFEAFGKVSATKTGATGAASFIQMRSVRKHMSGDAHARLTVENVLNKAEKDTHSTRISKVVASLKAGNVFSTVLDEIDNMIKLIGEEAAADLKNKEWCETERSENKASLAQKNADIISLDSTIDEKTKDINAPKTGLKAQIESTETALVQNTESQKTETAERTEDNLAYQQDIKNLQSAQSILNKALKVLEAYYNDLSKKLAAGEALIQHKEEPNAPEAWKGDGSYAGQKDQGGDIIKMLTFILDESVKEENEAHADEEKAQADYEDSMAQLKSEEASAQKSLVDLQETLATTEKELLEAQEDLKATTKDKEAIEAYLLKIKPGCDFIKTNYDLREKNRKTEKDALEKAISLIKATPAYKSAVNAATVESYGECKEPCVEDSDHVKCKACQASVTIPAFCAGHKGTKGC